jgi:HTH-type transcriptional regulator / antitoxin HigA
MVKRAAQNEYKPSIVFPPGETLGEELEVRGMLPAELASEMGYPLNTIVEIITGEGRITPEIATQLERVLGISANFWLDYERGYREWLAQRTGSVAIAA